MGSRSLFEPKGRVLNGFTAHSQPAADPLLEVVSRNPARNIKQIFLSIDIANIN